MKYLLIGWQVTLGIKKRYLQALFFVWKGRRGKFRRGTVGRKILH